MEPSPATLSSTEGGVAFPQPAAELERRDLATELQHYERVMLSEIGDRGLPTQQVLVPLGQRARMLSNLDGALELLDPVHRARSLYLSKFVMAVGAGLFDAALNYLWDETISELRRRVVSYDLKYFYDLAVKAPERRNKLKVEDDLPNVQDSELIAAASTMGLVSDVGYKQLDLVRHMRNYASAAHPNQNELSGLQLASFLETCIREVIALPESSVMAEVRRLLANVREQAYGTEQAAATASFFGQLPALQASNLGQGLFGIYVDTTSPVVARDNVRLLMPKLWPFLDEEVRRGFGVRYGRFIANGDQQQAELAREVLDTVDATSYLPESVRVADIDAALDGLRAAHDGMNNFRTSSGTRVGCTYWQGSRAGQRAQQVRQHLGRRLPWSWFGDRVERRPCLPITHRAVRAGGGQNGSTAIRGLGHLEQVAATEAAGAVSGVVGDVGAEVGRPGVPRPVHRHARLHGLGGGDAAGHQVEAPGRGSRCPAVVPPTPLCPSESRRRRFGSTR